MTAADRFQDIVRRLTPAAGVTEGTGFGRSAGLRAHGKIFAMAGDDGLVLKLPQDRCRVLVEEGAAHPFDAGKGRPMREWVVVHPDAVDRWPDLAEEALRFVGTTSRT